MNHRDGNLETLHWISFTYIYHSVARFPFLWTNGGI